MPNDGPRRRWIIFTFWALLLAAYAFASLSNVDSSVQIVSYCEIKQMIRTAEVGQALLEDHAITALGEDDVAAVTPRLRAGTPPTPEPGLSDSL